MRQRFCMRRGSPRRQLIEHLKRNTRTRAEMRERIERAMCSERCAQRGVTPCWSSHTDRPDAMEWPNPFCELPGCHDLARAVMDEISLDLEEE